MPTTRDYWKHMQKSSSSDIRAFKGRDKLITSESMEWDDQFHERLNRISKEGLKENFWNYVQRTTGERSIPRFVWQGTITTLLTNFPTVLGAVLRGIIYRGLLGGVGSSCFIERNVRFSVPQRVFLGNRVLVGESSYFDVQFLEGEIRVEDDVRIGRYCFLRAGPGNICMEEDVQIGTFSALTGSGGLRIGKNTLVARNVLLMSGQHIYKDPTVPIRFQGSELAKREIGEDVWLGANVVVLPGVTIGNGAVVGAGAVVTKDIPSYSLAVGVPAKVIGKRG